MWGLYNQNAQAVRATISEYGGLGDEARSYCHINQETTSTIQSHVVPRDCSAMPKSPLELGLKGGVARDGVTSLAQRCGKAAKTSNIGHVTTQRPP